MQRDIVFRGKRTDNGQWVEGDLTRYSEVMSYITVDLIENEMYEVDAQTVGQYTGLCDKNGKRIFEGDIIWCRKHIGGNWIDECVERGYVEMNHGAFGLHRRFRTSQGLVDGYYRPFKDWLEDYEYEVIGNIHDNPELIGGAM